MNGFESLTDINYVRKFLVDHAPDWADLPIKPVLFSGTDNRMFRLGSDAVLRFAKRPEAAPALAKELAWVPRLTGLPLSVPKVLFHGRASTSPQIEFGILSWIEGQIATPDTIHDPTKAALDLAEFLCALQRVDTDEAPIAGASNHHRGIALHLLSDKVRASIDILADELDGAMCLDLWDLACGAPCTKNPVWIHGDLKADNLLAEGGKLNAVIDWGLSAVGDPAVDYAVAWTWIAPESRPAFRAACAIIDDDWHKAQGWALYCAVIALSYYRGRSHPDLCRQSRMTLSNLGVLVA